MNRLNRSNTKPWFHLVFQINGRQDKTDQISASGACQTRIWNLMCSRFCLMAINGGVHSRIFRHIHIFDDVWLQVSSICVLFASSYLAHPHNKSLHCSLTSTGTFWFFNFDVALRYISFPSISSNADPFPPEWILDTIIFIGNTYFA